MGREHANRGRGWEERLAWRHDLYNRARTAVILKTDPKIVREKALPQGRFVARYGGEGPPDFVIISGAWTFFADAKESRQNGWPYGKLEVHQAQDLDALEQQGPRCAGLLLLHAAEQHQAFVVAWSDVRLRWWAWRQRQIIGQKSAAGEGSLSWADAGELALWTGSSVFEPLDYLPTTIQALERRLAESAALETRLAARQGGTG